MDDKRNFNRRDFLLASAGAGLMAMVPPGVRSGAWAAGSDAPEKKEVRIGFIPLTDCSSVVMAAVQKFDEKYGIKIIPTKEASWAGVRDKLVNGELDMAHVLWGLIYGVHMGVGGPKKDMAILMNLNHNGQAITLSKKLADKGAVDAASLAKLMASDKREYTFAQTFPTGTHAMWLYYWLASAGVNPMKDAKVTHKPTIFVLTDSLASCTDVYTMTRGGKSITARTAMTLLRRDGKWQVKTMAEGGWGDMKPEGQAGTGAGSATSGSSGSAEPTERTTK